MYRKGSTALFFLFSNMLNVKQWTDCVVNSSFLLFCPLFSTWPPLELFFFSSYLSYLYLSLLFLLPPFFFFSLSLFICVLLSHWFTNLLPSVPSLASPSHCSFSVQGSKTLQSKSLVNSYYSGTQACTHTCMNTHVSGGALGTDWLALQAADSPAAERMLWWRALWQSYCFSCAFVHIIFNIIRLNLSSPCHQ